MATFKVYRVQTKPFDGQKPGTSGLRTKVKVFAQPHYLENFVQATFDALKIKGKTLVVSGDGRYYSKEAIQIIIKMSAANGVKSIWVGQNGLLSTPAVSAVIRERVGKDGSKASGSFILTASHNPGGPTEDFGIKYNMENGGPAPEAVTDKIYENTTTIKEYLIAEDVPDVDISKLGTSSFTGPEGEFEVEVFDATETYVQLMKSIFDFEAIKKLLACPKFSFCYDSLHGVAGVYASRIFVKELGASESSLLNCTPKEDFGGGHPDPIYATELVQCMGFGKSSSSGEPPEFGAAADGDADRNMIMGKRFFVTPSDSVAIIAANAVEAIPYFSGGLKGVARSMPTSAALDVVAKALNLELFEVPTGWKFLGNLMDAGKCSVCGEESFGTGSDHVREMDGIWAVLAWLSILAYRNKDKLGGGELVTVEDIVRQHWAKYGRHYYTRYDYENVDSGGARELMAHLVNLQSNLPEVNKIVKSVDSDVANVVAADEFEYKDPVDGSVSKHQGIRYFFADGSRLVFCLSGTGSEGATVHAYIEKYEKDSSKTSRYSQDALKPLINVARKLSKKQEFTGRMGDHRRAYDQFLFKYIFGLECLRPILINERWIHVELVEEMNEDKMSKAESIKNPHALAGWNAKDQQELLDKINEKLERLGKRIEDAKARFRGSGDPIFLSTYLEFQCLTTLSRTNVWVGDHAYIMHDVPEDIKQRMKNANKARPNESPESNRRQFKLHDLPGE